MSECAAERQYLIQLQSWRIFQSWQVNCCLLPTQIDVLQKQLCKLSLSLHKHSNWTKSRVFGSSSNLHRVSSAAGLCGGSASGKTTVANKIIEALDVPWVVLLSMDSFYKVQTPSASGATCRLHTTSHRCPPRCWSITLHSLAHMETRRWAVCPNQPLRASGNDAAVVDVWTFFCLTLLTEQNRFFLSINCERCLCVVGAE